MQLKDSLRVLLAGLASFSGACNSTSSSSANRTGSLAGVPASNIPEMKQTLYYLADDAREGRGVGTDGLNDAAEFIAARFKTLGLRPVPRLNGYFQEFEMDAGQGVGAKTALKFGDRDLSVKQDFMPLAVSAEKPFAGQVAFVGYAASNTDKAYNDFEGIDVKGKIALVLRYEPRDEKGKSKFSKTGANSPSANFTSKARAAAKAGAVAMVVVDPNHDSKAPKLMPLGGEGWRASIPVVQVTVEVADEMLKAGGLADIRTLKSQIDADLKPMSKDLSGVTVAGEVEIEKVKAGVKNVVAMLPGSTKPDEYIVVSAHYDHLGRGALGGSLTRGSAEIHHGADDNASGTTTVLDIAERLTRRGRLERSVIFCLFTGEEEGLIGSAHFVRKPPVSLKKIVANLNIDMVGRVSNSRVLVGGAGTAEAFEKMIKEADAQLPVEVSYIGRGGFGPSDHASFAAKKIPVLFFFTGLHADYHRPSDTPDKINYIGMGMASDLGVRLVEEMSRMPRQAYVAKFDNQPALLDQNARPKPTTNGTEEPPRRVTLGVIPEYGTEDAKDGVKISGTTEGTPAALAGLKGGDTIVELGGTKIASLYDLTEFLGRSKAGEKIKVIIVRDEKRMELDVTLAEKVQG